MKDRIIQYLNEFANNKKNNLSSELCEELKISESELQRKSKEVLFTILHQYSQFSISTIDAFFQRIIRSFIREAGMVSNFRLELDNSLVMEKVLDELMLELGENKSLTKWMVKYSERQLDEGRNWDIKKNLLDFSQEIFKETFKGIEADILKIDNKRNESTLSTFKKIETDFLDFMQQQASQALKLIDQNNIETEDFKFKKSGTTLKYFTEFAERRYFPHKGQRIQDALEDANKWADKKSEKQALLTSLVESHLMTILKTMIEHDIQNIANYKTATLVKQQFYNLVLVRDLLNKLNEYKIKNNVMLLSDASNFLNTAIGENDTPFVYEKIGSFFKHYLIDEFQDTSGSQWQNFKPLLKESGDQQYFNLIVGDVKQSIYRWRAGNIELMQHRLAEDLGNEATNFIILDTNYRSAGNVIDFNNLLFAKVAMEMKATLNAELPAEVFGDVNQNKFRFPKQGFVRMNFLEAKQTDDWKTDALQQIPIWIESLYDIGAQPSDVAILVNRHKEGQMVTDFLLQYAATSKAKNNYSYAVVSNESLLLNKNWAINVLLNSLRYLLDNHDYVAGGQLVYELSSHQDIFSKILQNGLIAELPKEFVEQRQSLLGLSLFELVEDLIVIFKLDMHSDDFVYLQTFQDIILEFSFRERSDIASFLEWWESQKDRKSIQVSSDVNAIKVLTIHKAKGLQFKYVIIPFCDWKLNHTHPPLLWQTIDQPQFNNSGPLPIKYSKELQETFFANQYEAEFVKVHIDNLNKLYVAFTRAEEGMMVIAPLPKSTKDNAEELTSIDKIVYRAISSDENLKQNFEGNVFSIGVLELLEPTAKKLGDELCELTTYHSANWRDKLIIQNRGTEFFGQKQRWGGDKLHFGLILHDLMSKIINAEDVEPVFENYFSVHPASQSMVDELKEKVAQILNNDLMKDWFSGKWEVKTEATVIIPDGRKKRFDRVMLGSSQTLVVDYKTGEKRESDRKQLKQYATILKEMGYPSVEAFLVYLQELEIEKV